MQNRIWHCTWSVRVKNHNIQIKSVRVKSSYNKLNFNKCKVVLDFNWTLMRWLVQLCYYMILAFWNIEHYSGKSGYHHNKLRIIEICFNIKYKIHCKKNFLPRKYISDALCSHRTSENWLIQTPRRTLLIHEDDLPYCKVNAYVNLCKI